MYFFDDSALDVFQSVEDRILTPKGIRELLPRYGFTQEWYTLTRPRLEREVREALASDTRIYNLRFSYERGGRVIVTIYATPDVQMEVTL